jgi:tetratricopeptide (TPR) repeat protein
MGAVGRGLAALDAIDIDTVDPGELDGLYVAGEMGRVGEERATCFFETMDRGTRLRRLADLYRYALHRSMGIVHCEEGQWRQAVLSLSRALQIIADDGYTACYLAQAFENLGRVEEAISRYREAISLEPLFYDARTRLFTVLNEQSRREEALQLAEESAVIASPHSLGCAQWLYFAAIIQNYLGRHLIARQTIRECLIALDGVEDDRELQAAKDVRKKVAKLQEVVMAR